MFCVCLGVGVTGREKENKAIIAIDYRIIEVGLGKCMTFISQTIHCAIIYIQCRCRAMCPAI